MDKYIQGNAKKKGSYICWTTGLVEKAWRFCYYRVPVSAMMRITGHSKGLLEEHLALVEKHFPDEESLVSYIGNRGIKLEKSS